MQDPPSAHFHSIICVVPVLFSRTPMTKPLLWARHRARCQEKYREEQTEPLPARAHPGRERRTVDEKRSRQWSPGIK